MAGRSRALTRTSLLCRSVVPVRCTRPLASSPPSWGGAAQQDTIYALSSAQGKAAIAVIRVTGSQAKDVYAAVVRAASPCPLPNRLHVATLHHPRTGEVLDQGMAVLFQRPASVTGEDVLELHIHGGRATVQGVLSALSSLPCRAAQPGEFTRRAFLAGKMDLTAVEGLADLLNADTEAQRRQALVQASGALAALYDGWRTELITCCAHVEAVLDFAADQDGVEDAVVMGAVVPKVHSLLAAMHAHIASGARGELIRDGIRLTIVGPPNAGKSSLLNALARRPAAIVSSIPGTTRDIVEVQLDLAGLPVLVSDTAGLRDCPSDAVEEEGIRRAKERAREAQIRVVLLDKNDVTGVGAGDCIPLHALPEHLQGYFQPRPPSSSCHTQEAVVVTSPVTLLVLNKHDEIVEGGVGQGIPQGGAVARAGYIPVHRISCLTQAGLPALLSLLEGHVQGLAWGQGKGQGEHNEAPVITRERHRQHVLACVRSLESFLHASSSGSGVPPDMACEELRLATRALAALTGRVDTEELLDVIFRDFCIGK